jgi:hypothetical protein
MQCRGIIDLFSFAVAAKQTVGRERREACFAIRTDPAMFE